MDTQTAQAPGGSKLRNWRIRKGLTLAQVGELLGGISHAHVSNLERGVDGPSIALAGKIETLTGGKVKVSSWVPVLSPSVQPVEESRKGAA